MPRESQHVEWKEVWREGHFDRTHYAYLLAVLAGQRLAARLRTS
ncbi:MAG TPA: hypothetical protein VK163_14190 [Opitutaceae bacterium]|nr:hypothetical protein [Opitutaceae bacterium]